MSPGPLTPSSFPRKPGAGTGLWVVMGVGHASGPAPRGARALRRPWAMKGGPHTPSMGLSMAPLSAPPPGRILRFPPCPACPSTTPFQAAKPWNPGASLASQCQTALVPVVSSSQSPGSWAHQASEMAQAQPTATIAPPRSLQVHPQGGHPKSGLVPAPHPAGPPTWPGWTPDRQGLPGCSLTSSQHCLLHPASAPHATPGQAQTLAC